jgi:tRNA dimethylallyltransferase
VLTGPTASGKTALALELAQAHPGLEIVNADSMQVYRGMDIGTAKPTREELARVPHHLIDVRDPPATYTAGEFVRETWAAVDDIHRRGRRALIVGGTGFYLRALFWGIWEGPAADPELRARLDALALPELHARLQKRDPESALRIGPADRYRLTRALELIERSGKSPTELEAEMTGEPDPRLTLWVVDREPAELERRLRERAGLMLEQGLIEEVRRVRQAYPQARALGAVGYKQVCDYLDGVAPAGRLVKPGAAGLREEIELATRQLVKKQRTWFKNLRSRLGDAGSRHFVLPADADACRTEFDRLYKS